MSVIKSVPCNLEFALTACKNVEAGCSEFGCHVALTGGTLYKEGSRKDLDILFYRIRQVQKINYDGLFSYLKSIGFSTPEGFGWIYKSRYRGVNVDIFFPEEQSGGVYGGEGDALQQLISNLNPFVA